MPTKHAALKDLRKTRKRTARNLRLKTHMRHLWKSAQDLVKAGQKSEAKTAVLKFQQIADKAAKHRVISQNAVDRRKAALMRSFAKMK